MSNLFEYTFRDKALEVLALTHRSFELSGSSNNEKLEFLGDAVLNICVAHICFQMFPHLSEGDLTKNRSSLVRMETLAQIAWENGFDKKMMLGKKEQSLPAENKNRILASGFEAWIGALFLEAGYDFVKEGLEVLYRPWLLGEKTVTADAKSDLQVLIQKKYNKTPTYHLIQQVGPSHEPQFEVVVRWEPDFEFHGKGSSRKRAEENAARLALEKLQNVSS